MRPKDFTDPASNPNLISGIHNYCDRWCERCAFTSRCAVYAMEDADPDVDPASRDITNDAFWKKLSAIFAETQAMIVAIAEERGVDLSEEALKVIGEQNEIDRRNARSHPLAGAAEEYAHAVTQWFERESSKLDLVTDTPEESNPAHNADDEDEYVEVIRWYQFFIAAKLIRALMSSLDEDDYLTDDTARDSDGSAKAALIGIDRSISAWKLMYDCRSAEQDDQSHMIQKWLLHLEQLRLSAEREFPRARDFIRPGFDEPSLDMLH